MPETEYEDAYRHFIRLALESCHFCPGWTRATWAVLEKESNEHLAVCDRHKYTAFS